MLKAMYLKIKKRPLFIFYFYFLALGNLVCKTIRKIKSQLQLHSYFLNPMKNCIKGLTIIPPKYCQVIIGVSPFYLDTNQPIMIYSA